MQAKVFQYQNHFSIDHVLSDNLASSDIRTARGQPPSPTSDIAPECDSTDLANNLEDLGSSTSRPLSFRSLAGCSPPPLHTFHILPMLTHVCSKRLPLSHFQTLSVMCQSGTGPWHPHFACQVEGILKECSPSTFMEIIVCNTRITDTGTLFLPLVSPAGLSLSAAMRFAHFAAAVQA